MGLTPRRRSGMVRNSVSACRLVAIPSRPAEPFSPDRADGRDSGSLAGRRLYAPAAVRAWAPAALASNPWSRGLVGRFWQGVLFCSSFTKLALWTRPAPFPYDPRSLKLDRWGWLVGSASFVRAGDAWPAEPLWLLPSDRAGFLGRGPKGRAASSLLWCGRCYGSRPCLGAARNGALARGSSLDPAAVLHFRLLASTIIGTTLEQARASTSCFSARADGGASESRWGLLGTSAAADSASALPLDEFCAAF